MVETAEERLSVTEEKRLLNQNRVVRLDSSLHVNMIELPTELTPLAGVGFSIFLVMFFESH